MNLEFHTFAVAKPSSDSSVTAPFIVELGDEDNGSTHEHGLIQAVSNTNGDVVEVAFAFVSPGDEFRKEKGISQAMGKFFGKVKGSKGRLPYKILLHKSEEMDTRCTLIKFLNNITEWMKVHRVSEKKGIKAAHVHADGKFVLYTFGRINIPCWLAPDVLTFDPSIEESDQFPDIDWPSMENETLEAYVVGHTQP